MTKIKVGQTVFVRNATHRGGNDNKLKPAVVVQVGRKYFALDNPQGARFHIDTLRHDNGDYSPRYTVYLSEQEYNDMLESNELIDKVRSRIGHYGAHNLTIGQLRQIYDIINT